ncbi:unnamed protein product [Hydatigera taeniaeformis]|uniref:IgGFc_binding domain-containing protein n=1 Tax=Hydatigena taeniaeformis TaxID=6205 RepID=A0A0R3WQ03_HYDTA|nr:unnamed protein product [Hydatigera taeniaeformis]
MFLNDGRVVYGKLGSTFKYQTVLPGLYDRVVSGMHSVTIKDWDCSTPLFVCTIEEDMPYRSVATLTGTMNYGLKRVTFFGKYSIPITILFYTDHYWPEMDDHTFQWQYSLPLVTYAKDTDIVTLSAYILHVSAISLPNQPFASFKAKPDVVNDFISLLPMEEIVSYFLGSATRTSILSSLVWIGR